MNRKAGRVAGCKTAAPVAAALLLLVAFTLGLCCLGVCRACGDADAGNARAVDALITEFSARNAFEHVRILAEGIGPRPAGSEAERRAAEYIAGELRSYGYSVRIEEFGLPVPEWMREAGSSVETTSLNVVAVRPGKSPSAFVVGAHTSPSPGRTIPRRTSLLTCPRPPWNDRAGWPWRSSVYGTRGTGRRRKG